MPREESWGQWAPAEMLRAVSVLVPVMLVLVLRPVSATPALAGTWAHSLPLESIPAATLERVRSIAPNAVPAFAVHSDWRPLDAYSDYQGRSVFVFGREPLSDVMVAMGTEGTVLWEHEIVGCRAGSSGGILRLGANGSALATIGMSDDGEARYLLLRPDGSTALDDTLESLGAGRVLTLSPCGKYTHRYRQGPDEITLQLVAGGVRHLPLPRSTGVLEPLDELPTVVRFLSAEHLFVSTPFAKTPPRRLLCDLSVEPPRMIKLEGQKDLPEEQHNSPRLAGDHTSVGDLILFEEWEGEYDLKYEVCCYDRWGARKWHQFPKLRPSWIVAAKDRPIAAVANSTLLTTLDTRTGAVLDTQRLWEERTHASPWRPREIAFELGLLTLWARGGGDGITPILISVGIGEDGKISVPIVTTDWMWGLSHDRPICGAAVPDSSGGWLITGFRRE